MIKKASVIMLGTVEKIIQSPFPSAPDKAHIKVVGADHFHREIRIDNSLTNGEEVGLKLGAHVNVSVEGNRYNPDK